MDRNGLRDLYETAKGYFQRHPQELGRVLRGLIGLRIGGAARGFPRGHEGVRPGVVSLPHGWGHDRPGARSRQRAAYSTISLSGNAAFSGVPVFVRGA
jgi:hypothetical protein